MKRPCGGGVGRSIDEMSGQWVGTGLSHRGYVSHGTWSVINRPARAVFTVKNLPPPLFGEGTFITVHQTLPPRKDGRTGTQDTCCCTATRPHDCTRTGPTCQYAATRPDCCRPSTRQDECWTFFWPTTRTHSNCRTSLPDNTYSVD